MEANSEEIIMLLASHIMLARTSFARVLPISEAAADLFYDRLFEIAPQVRPLFPDDLREQKRKLMAMLGMAVGALNDLETLVPKVKALGARPVAYGATAAHYEVNNGIPRT
jgi:hemoglobin-like flavoprotein